MARSKTALVEVALNEHLSAEPAYAPTVESGHVSSRCREAVDTGFYTTMLLAAELDSCNDYTQPTWYEPGQEFETSKMEPSVHATPLYPAQRVIAMTLLPRADTQLSRAFWNVSCPSVVHRQSQRIHG